MKARLTFRLDEQLAAELERLARRNERSTGAEARRAVKAHLAREDDDRRAGRAVSSPPPPMLATDVSKQPTSRSGATVALAAESVDLDETELTPAHGDPELFARTGETWWRYAPGADGERLDPPVLVGGVRCFTVGAARECAWLDATDAELVERYRSDPQYRRGVERTPRTLEEHARQSLPRAREYARKARAGGRDPSAARGWERSLRRSLRRGRRWRSLRECGQQFAPLRIRPRARGAGRPAARRSLGPRSGQDPGDDGDGDGDGGPSPRRAELAAEAVEDIKCAVRARDSWP